MARTLKLLAVMAALAVATAMTGTMARADSINFGGNITLTPGGAGCGATSPCQSLSFSQLTITSTSPVGDALVNSNVTLTGDVDFISATGTQFQNNPDSISLGNSTTGTLSGDINFIDISGGGANGIASYTMTVDLNNLKVTGGTSNILSQWAASNTPSGNGILTFQFADSNIPTNLSALLNDPNCLQTSVSGSIDAPEPASLSLLGIGLIGLGLAFRRRLRAVAS